MEHSMKYGLENAQMIDASHVFLDQSNPRHEPYEDQDEVIAYLCREEQVLPLAKDIAKIGLNPLELFALVPEGEGSYISAEGNRRLCAIKLLNDPDLAPADQRNEFKKAAASWEVVEKLFAVVFADREEVRVWLDRIHAGADDGRGRRQWKADQKARNSVYSKNEFALAVLDLGESMGFISPEDRKGRLSTVQRYLGNPLMRDVLGLDAKDTDRPTTTLNDDDFSKVLKEFMESVATKGITTRDNRDEITAYSHRLRALEGLSAIPVARHEVKPKEADKTTTKPAKPTKPLKPTKIPPSDALQIALKDMPSYKLEQLYFSLCSLSLATHTPLIAIGAWSFLETLTAICGRKSGTDFLSYLSIQTLQNLGLGGKTDTSSLRQAVERISELGNSTKHNKTASAFNGDQLANDFQTMEKMLIALAKDGKGKT
jgi:hypothetical protein